MLDTISALRWIFCFSGALALLTSISHGNIWGIILYVIAIILAIPGFSNVFRPKRPRRAAIICCLAAFVLMGVAQGVINEHAAGDQVSIVTAADFENQDYISGSDVLIGEPLLGSLDGNTAEPPGPNSSPDAAVLPEADEMKIHFIDVGQGDATLVQSDGQFMLIDTGDIDAADKLLNYLDSLGVNALDTLVITHPHGDHINVTALNGLIQRMEIKTVRIPDTTSSTGHALLSYALDVMDEADLDVVITQAGETWNIGDVKVTALAPKGSDYEELNDFSIVTRLECGNSSAIISADAEAVSEMEMVFDKQPLKADILRVGHHGSTTSSSKIYLAAVRPKFAVISCGTGNEYGHPHNETLVALSLIVGKNIYRTDLHGTIIATCSADGTIQLETDS